MHACVYGCSYSSQNLSLCKLASSSVVSLQQLVQACIKLSGELAASWSKSELKILLCKLALRACQRVLAAADKLVLFQIWAQDDACLLQADIIHAASSHCMLAVSLHGVLAASTACCKLALCACCKLTACSYCSKSQLVQACRVDCSKLICKLAASLQHACCKLSKMLAIFVRDWLRRHWEITWFYDFYGTE
jgi:hypothetical protein